MAKAIRKKILRPLDLRVRPEAKPFLIWDEPTRGLALSVLPTGRKSWKFIYAFAGKTKWYTIGDANALGLEGARARARNCRVEVDEGMTHRPTRGRRHAANLSRSTPSRNATLRTTRRKTTAAGSRPTI